MHTRQLFIAKARFYSSVSLLYIATLLFVWYATNPLARINQWVKPTKTVATLSMPAQAAPKPVQAISGKPIRIVIPSVKIDLVVDDGIYNPDDNTWSLSGRHAQFALPTSLANDKGGNTFIYGHNNAHVFGPLPKIQPGEVVAVYTDTGYIFTYTFESAKNLRPDDTSVLRYDGPPILTIQTCSGSWNEWRRMFTFKFEKVTSEKPTPEKTTQGVSS